MNDATQNNDKVYIYLSGNGDILNIESKEPSTKNTFQADLKDVCDIRKFYECLGSKKAKECGIDRNEIIKKNNSRYIVELNVYISIPECNIPIVFGMFDIHTYTIFKGVFSLKCKYFNSDVYFQNCEFDIFIAKDCIFKGNVHFDRSKFNNDGYFGVTNSIFMQKVGFCDVEFKEIPNFSIVSFERIDLVNFVGVKIADSFDKVQELTKGEPAYISKYLRDSFRIIKRSLIKQNNILDAANFHKLELYCKEIELDFKKPKKLRDCIDSFILAFYRLTSDHHTDLLKSFHSLLLVIGVFGLLSGIVIAGIAGFNGDISSIKPHTFEDYLVLIYDLVIAGFVGFCNEILSINTLMEFYNLIYDSKECYDSKIGDFISSNSFCIFILNLSILLFSLSIIIALYIFKRVQCFTQNIIAYARILIHIVCKGHFLTQRSFIQKTIEFANILCKKICRCFLVIPSYIITFLILAISPKYIFPAIDIFTDKRNILDQLNIIDQFGIINPLGVIGAIYTIFFALMLYSLIKTARKNSIVPS